MTTVPKGGIITEIKELQDKLAKMQLAKYMSKDFNRAEKVKLQKEIARKKAELARS